MATVHPAEARVAAARPRRRVGLLIPRSFVWRAHIEWRGARQVRKEAGEPRQDVVGHACGGIVCRVVCGCVDRVAVVVLAVLGRVIDDERPRRREALSTQPLILPDLAQPLEVALMAQ